MKAGAGVVVVKFEEVTVRRQEFRAWRPARSFSGSNDAWYACRTWEVEVSQRWKSGSQKKSLAQLTVSQRTPRRDDTLSIIGAHNVVLVNLDCLVSLASYEARSARDTFDQSLSPVIVSTINDCADYITYYSARARSVKLGFIRTAGPDVWGVKASVKFSNG